MSKKTRRLTLCALFSALTTVMLYISSVFPTGQLGIAAFASLFTAAAIIECGISSGVFVYIISCILGVLIVPVQGAFLLYIIFLGYYPIAKCLIERLKNIFAEWVIKLVLFNAALSAVYLFFETLIYAYFGEGLFDGVFFFYLFGNLVFALYDYGYSKLVWIYVSKISKKIKRK